MRKCYCCGADVPDNAKFCPKCGKMTEITQDLIDRARADDADAQTELYERTYKTVYSRIRAKVPDEDTAMDIMQESYLRAFTSLDQLQKAETFPSWLLTIASRQTCAWYRKNGKENENVRMSRLEYENDDTVSDEDDLLDQPEYREDFSPDESLDRAETGRLLSEILDTLPEDQRIILTMRYYDEMSLKEISEELGVNLSTVKTRLTAGKKKVEAKVLELEKSGTKLYSLGPVAFLVFLLHHMELFAPAIPADTIIGLTAAGAAGAGGAAATAAHVTAGAAAKTAVAAAAKGVSVKVIAIVAAAVVVAGGGVTAGVVAANNSHDPGTADTSDSVSAEVVKMSETEEPSKTVEPTEEPSKIGEPTEEPSESPSEPMPELPSYEDVYDMTAPLGDWAANTFGSYYYYDGPYTPETFTGEIILNTNEAVELAALAAASDTDYMNFDVPADQIDAYMKRMFGSQFQLSDYTNTLNDSGYYYNEYGSAFSAEYADYSSLFWPYRAENGDFSYEGYQGDPTFPSVTASVKSVDRIDDSTCAATVRYDASETYMGDGYTYYGLTTWSFDVTYTMTADDGADYGWAVTALVFSDRYNENDETVKMDPTEYVVHTLVDPLANWSIWAMDPGTVITPTLNQAAELAACAYFWSRDGWAGDFETDPDGPVPYYSYILEESTISFYLTNMFGLSYDLSGFTNTVSTDGTGFSGSGLGSSLDTYNGLQMMLCKVNGQYEYTLLATDGLPVAGDVIISGIEKSGTGEDRYVATVEYQWVQPNPDGSSDEGTREVDYELAPGNGTGYGWIITKITYK